MNITELPADFPYACRYAWAAVRGLPAPAVEDEPIRSGGQFQRTYTIWTAEMDAVLISDYAFHREARQIPLLAKRLNVSMMAIYSRVRKLKLALPKQRKAA